MSFDDTAAADKRIEAYMKFCRRKFTHSSLIPKQHVLESHVSVMDANIGVRYGVSWGTER